MTWLRSVTAASFASAAFSATYRIVMLPSVKHHPDFDQIQITVNAVLSALQKTAGEASAGKRMKQPKVFQLDNPRSDPPHPDRNQGMLRETLGHRCVCLSDDGSSAYVMGGDKAPSSS